MECLQNAEFVLDKYHKNKAIKAMTAGIENKYRNNNDKEIREALNEENLKLYEQLTDSLIMQNPDRAETISQNAAYLQRFVKGIGICKKDERALPLIHYWHSQKIFLQKLDTNRRRLNLDILTAKCYNMNRQGVLI